MSYLDFLNAAQAPEDAKEAARKLAEAKRAEEEQAEYDEGIVNGTESESAEMTYEAWESLRDHQPIKRGPGRPKKQP